MGEKRKRRESVSFVVGMVLAFAGISLIVIAIFVGPVYGDALNGLGVTVAVAAVGAFFVSRQERSAQASDNKLDDLVLVVAGMANVVSERLKQPPSVTDEKLDAINALLTAIAKPDLGRPLGLSERLLVLATGRWPTSAHSQDRAPS
jgi:hypothetical protein